MGCPRSAVCDAILELAFKLRRGVPLTLSLVIPDTSASVCPQPWHPLLPVPSGLSTPAIQTLAVSQCPGPEAFRYRQSQLPDSS